MHQFIIFCFVNVHFLKESLIALLSKLASYYYLLTSLIYRYLLILFRDAPVEVWMMTKHPIMVKGNSAPNPVFFYSYEYFFGNSSLSLCFNCWHVHYFISMLVHANYVALTYLST